MSVISDDEQFEHVEQLEDFDMEPGLQLPFDIGLALPNPRADDCPNQEIALAAALFGQNTDHDEESLFEDQPQTSCSLKHLKRIYDQQNAALGLAMLSKRTEVTFLNSQYVTKNTDPDLAWMPDHQYLDLMICVGNGLGLGALLPNLQVHHNYELKFDLRQPFRMFSAKFSKLGFDPMGSMLWIG